MSNSPAYVARRSSQSKGRNERRSRENESVSEASREEIGERGGEENACRQTGTNRGLFFKYAASGGREFLLAKILISLFEVNKLCKIIPSVALCEEAGSEANCDCSGDEFDRYYILDGFLD